MPVKPSVLLKKLQKKVSSDLLINLSFKILAYQKVPSLPFARILFGKGSFRIEISSFNHHLEIFVLLVYSSQILRDVVHYVLRMDLIISLKTKYKILDREEVFFAVQT